MKNQPQLLSRNAFKHALRGGYLWHYVSWAALRLPLCVIHTRKPTRTSSATSSKTSSELHATSQMPAFLTRGVMSQRHLKTQVSRGKNVQMLPLPPVPVHGDTIPPCSFYRCVDCVIFRISSWKRLDTRKITVSSQTKLNTSILLTRHQLFRHPVCSMY